MIHFHHSLIFAGKPEASPNFACKSVEEVASTLAYYDTATKGITAQQRPRGSGL
jgi:hypothetical protein